MFYKNVMKQFIIYISLVFSLLACNNKNEKLTAFLKPFKEIAVKLKDFDRFHEISFLFIIDTSGSMDPMNEILSGNLGFLRTIFEKYPYYDYNFAFTTMSPKIHFKDKSVLFVDETSNPCRWSASDFTAYTEMGPYLRYSFNQGLNIQPDDFVCFISHNIINIKGHNGTEPFFQSLSLLLHGAEGEFKSRFFSQESFLILFFISDAFGQDDTGGYASVQEDYEGGAELFAEDMWQLLRIVRGGGKHVRSYAVVPDNRSKDQCGGEGAGSTPAKYPFHLYQFIERTGGLRVSLCDSSWGDKLQNIYTDLSQSFFSRNIHLNEVPRVDTMEVFFNGQKVPKDNQTGWFFRPTEPSIGLGNGFNILFYPPGQEMENGERESEFTIRYHPVNIELLRKEDK